jgi:hypothetical protein
MAIISTITSKNHPLNKEFSLINSELKKKSHGILIDGDYFSEDVSLANFAELRKNLKADQAFCLGTVKPQYQHITKIVTTANADGINSISRNKQYFEFSDKPAFMLVDYDDANLTINEVADIVQSYLLAMGFDNVGVTGWHSSSALVYQEGDIPPFTENIKSGCHLYFEVSKASAIPIIGDLFEFFAWKKGYGEIKISKNGSLLSRHLFDKAVYSPERLIFEAPPSLGKGLALAPTYPLFREGGSVDCSNIKPLSTDQQTELANLITEAKEKIRPRATKVKKAYIKNEIENLMSNGMSERNAQVTAAQHSNNILTENFTLYGSNNAGGDWKAVNVSELLENPEQFTDWTFNDPFEELGVQRPRAKLLLCPKTVGSTEKVWKIRSFRHGESFYEIEPPAAIPESILDLDLPIPRFSELAPHKSKKGVILATVKNLKLLADCYGVSFKYDVISRKKEINFYHSVPTGDLSNDANIWRLTSLCNMNELQNNVVGLLPALFADNEVNPVLDHIKSNVWDGVSRIDALLNTLTLLNDDDKDYAREILTKWLIQCVAAADLAKSSPLTAKGIARAKFESVFILSGKQGGSKTDWLEKLVPFELRKYHAKGVLLDMSSKDSIFETTSNWVVELGELDATFRKSDISALKAFLSNSVDVIRRPYDLAANEYRRRSSFCATVNDSTFLHDTTGNRRYLPLNVVSCDKHHNVDMNQVWREIWELYINGARWWFEVGDDIAETILRHQRAAVDQDPIIEALIIWNGGDFSASQSEYPFSDKFTVPQLVLIAKNQNPLDKTLPRPTRKEIKCIRDFLSERGIFSAVYDGYSSFKFATKNKIREFESEKNNVKNENTTDF